jgi:hypothetical protein
VFSKRRHVSQQIQTEQKNKTTNETEIQPILSSEKFVVFFYEKSAYCNRWEDNIRMDLSVTVWEGADWIHLAQDRTSREIL